MSPRSPLAAELPAERVVVTADNRDPDRTAWDLSPLTVERGTLPTFDYALRDAQHIGGIERKEFGDFISCVTSERDRFERALTRMLAYPFRLVIVEASWLQLEAGDWRSKVSPNSVIGSVLGWQAMGIPFFFPGSRSAAEKYAAQTLYIVARRRYRELRSMLNSMPELEAAT